MRSSWYTLEITVVFCVHLHIDCQCIVNASLVRLLVLSVQYINRLFTYFIFVSRQQYEKHAVCISRYFMTLHIYPYPIFYHIQKCKWVDPLPFPHAPLPLLSVLLADDFSKRGTRPTPVSPHLPGMTIDSCLPGRQCRRPQRQATGKQAHLHVHGQPVPAPTRQTPCNGTAIFKDIGHRLLEYWGYH